jgi:ribosomal protein S18 acetylase RimI-like enzyme
LLAEDEDKAPGEVIGCVEMGVVHVPRLLANGLLDEIEQWGQQIDGVDGLGSAAAFDDDRNEAAAIAKLSGRAEDDRAESGDDSADAAHGLVKAPYLGNLAVSTEFRRQGVGSRLVREAEAIALAWGFDHMCLHVDADQPGAKALYAALGYECIAQEPAWHKHVGRVRRMFLTKKLDRSSRNAAPTEVESWDKAQVASSGRKLNMVEYLKLCVAELKRAR